MARCHQVSDNAAAPVKIGIDDDGRDQDLGAAKSVGQDAECNPADGPADEKNRKDDTAVPADLFR